jgi:putative FmdB family regulatory protein
MPTYEYRCDGCGHEFEIFQSITAKSLRKCPSCEKNTLERLISGGGAVLFKGSGFYETDYRSKDYAQKAEAEKKSAAGDAPSGSSPGKPEGGAPAKTEPKAEPGAGKGEKKNAGKKGAAKA